MLKNKILIRVKYRENSLIKDNDVIVQMCKTNKDILTALLITKRGRLLRVITI